MDSAHVVWQQANEVHVLLKRKLVVGGQWRISSSMGYSGIEEGIVRIDKICTREKVSGDMLEQIDSFTDSYLDLFTGDDDYDTEANRLDNTIWVQYSYTSPLDEGTYVFPIDEFLEHVSMT